MSCSFGFDPFVREPPDLFREHLPSCTHCASVVSIGQAAQHTWKAAQTRDDASRSVFREQRLLRGQERSRRKPALLWLTPALTFALGWAAAVFAPRLVRDGELARATTATMSDAPTAAAAPTEATTPPQAAAPLVVVAHRNVSLVGSTLPSSSSGANGSITVGRGAHLTLGFAVDAPLVEVNGPATVREDGGELLLDDGAIEVNGAGSLVVRTADARIRLDRSGCRIRKEGTLTRIERRSGTVVVQALGGAREMREILGGEPLLVGSAGIVERAVPPTSTTSTPPPATDGGWNAALALLDRDDRAGAERAFRAVAHDVRAPERLRARARFRAGQLALSRKDRAVGRTDLEPLVNDTDPSLASDAALLLARSAETPSERAAVWDRLLARDLPEPYLSNALRESKSRR